VVCGEIGEAVAQLGGEQRDLGRAPAELRAEVVGRAGGDVGA
jgi:hypothetical protein